MIWPKHVYFLHLTQVGSKVVPTSLLKVRKSEILLPLLLLVVVILSVIVVIVFLLFSSFSQYINKKSKEFVKYT